MVWKGNSMKIEQIKVGNLKPYEKNARVHTDEQIEQIKQSMIEFGFTNPILIDKNNEVIAGHGRLESAKQLVHYELDELKELLDYGITKWERDNN